MIRKEWIDPNTIYLAKPMNPRPLNQGFIESLRESMEEQGFLPQYPVKVFEAGSLTCVETDLQYTCVSGMHRTSAAQLAKIDEILCEVHTGDDDAFIEMMMTDNFEYDPARNSELGQIFTQREKRKACQRLLYIPKFLRMTNSALAEEWHTNEANIRRWRKEIVTSFDVTEASSNGEGGAPTFPETLSRVGITSERLQELRDINDSRERENADGNTVQVRKPRRDASDDEKSNFFEEIEMDLSVLREESDIDFDWNAVKQYCGEKWNIRVGWGMYQDLHIDQLRKLHKLLIEQDADFISRCTAIYVEGQALISFKDQLEKACKKTKRLFSKLIDADNEWDDKFKSKWGVFEGLVKSELNIEAFGNSRWDYDDLETAEAYRAATEQHKTVQEAIEKEADWIAEFMKKEKAAAAQKRKKVSKAWTEKRDAAIAAINDYPRDVSFDRIVSAAEKNLYKSHGYFNKIFDAETVSSKKNIGTLEDEIKSLDRLIYSVKNDVKWVAEIPAAKKAIEVIAEANGFKIGDEPSEPEFTITADDLHGISLEAIFQHVADRVICLDGLFDENEVMMELAQVLGNASRGQVGIQLYLLMKFALFLQPKSDIEGVEIEKEGNPE